MSKKYCSAKHMSKLASQLSSMHLAIGPLVRLFTRHMYQLVETRETWYQPKFLNAEVKTEMLFWRDDIKECNGLTYKPKLITSKIVFTDASDFGYGGFICVCSSKKICTWKILIF